MEAQCPRSGAEALETLRLVGDQASEEMSGGRAVLKLGFLAISFDCECYFLLMLKCFEICSFFLRVPVLCGEVICLFVGLFVFLFSLLGVSLLFIFMLCS